MTYSDIFHSVRQRAAAYLFWLKYNNRTDKYGKYEEWDYLDDAYRFLYTTIDKSFLCFCALQEGMGIEEYLGMLGVDL